MAVKSIPHLYEDRPSVLEALSKFGNVTQRNVFGSRKIELGIERTPKFTLTVEWLNKPLEILDVPSARHKTKLCFKYGDDILDWREYAKGEDTEYVQFFSSKSTPEELSACIQAAIESAKKVDGR